MSIVILSKYAKYILVTDLVFLIKSPLILCPCRRWKWSLVDDWDFTLAWSCVGLWYSMVYLAMLMTPLNTLRPRQNDHRFPDGIFKYIFLNENIEISIGISLKFVPNGPMNDIPSLVQTMAWRRPGDKPLPETMMASLLTHICVTRPQWVNTFCE